MLLARSTPEALQHQRIVHVNGHDYVLSEFIGAAPLRGRYVEGNEAHGNKLPQGFLVEQPPGSITPPHFHETNQFQVFVGGSGKMGKKIAAPVAVHFAGGHTPYGPIEAGADGVQYFTLRQVWDPGAKYMPANRDKLNPGPRRHRLASGIILSDGEELRARTTPGLDTIMQPEPDGLAAYLLRVGGGGMRETPDSAGGAGQYHVVVAGSILRHGKTMPRLSCLFVTADEEPYPAEAGPDGLEMLVLQFPRG